MNGSSQSTQITLGRAPRAIFLPTASSADAKLTLAASQCELLFQSTPSSLLTSVKVASEIFIFGSRQDNGAKMLLEVDGGQPVRGPSPWTFPKVLPEQDAIYLHPFPSSIPLHLTPSRSHTRDLDQASVTRLAHSEPHNLLRQCTQSQGRWHSSR